MSKAEVRNITKKFGAFTANDNISLRVAENSVHCIVGENGAGKSTLMNMLFGLIKPDSGEIMISGNPVQFENPHDAIAAGIGMVHQHFMLIDDFTVIENIILGNEPVKGMKLDLESAKAKIIEINERYSFGIDPAAKVAKISISLQQKVEILKLLYRDSDLLIFDEPTAVLSPTEIDSFIQMVEMFRETGKTVILITHKLREVERIADAVSVLRKGRLVYEWRKSEDEMNINKIATEIMGRASEQSVRHKKTVHVSSKSLVTLSCVSLTKEERQMLNNLSITVNEGEIHGIAGVEGNGQTELADIVAGIERDFEGEAKFGTDGSAVVPDDRLKKGMIREFSIGENMVLKKSGISAVTRGIARKLSEKVINSFDVRVPDPESPLGKLSGGNQQKSVIAREILTDRKVIVISHPTRGVDISATVFIHSLIIDERNKGKAILVISSDIDELFALSDRVSVIYKGSIVKTFQMPDVIADNGAGVAYPSHDTLLKEIGLLMTGAAT